MKPLLSVPLVFLAAVSLCTQLEASSVLPPCAEGTLQDYENSSGCVLGGGTGGVLVFSGFAFSALNPDGAPVLNASQIELTPVPGGLGGSFDFSGDFSVPAGDTLTYDIDYFLLIDPGPILGGGSLFLDPTGDVTFSESICADAPFTTNSDGAPACATPNGDTNPQVFTVGSVPPLSLFETFALNPPAFTLAYVHTDLVLTGGALGASSAGVVETDSVSSAQPEPVSSFLCFGGLIAIGIFRRYNK